MDHGHAWELLSPYRDGELNDTDREAVADHLALCEECRSERAAWDSMGAALFRRPTAPLPSNFSSRVMVRLADTASMDHDPIWITFRRWLLPPLGAALAALAMSVLIPENDSTDDTEALLLADAGGGSAGTGSILASSQDAGPFYEQILEE